MALVTFVTKVTKVTKVMLGRGAAKQRSGVDKLVRLLISLARLDIFHHVLGEA